MSARKKDVSEKKRQENLRKYLLLCGLELPISKRLELKLLPSSDYTFEDSKSWWRISGIDVPRLHAQLRGHTLTVKDGWEKSDPVYIPLDDVEKLWVDGFEIDVIELKNKPKVFGWYKYAHMVDEMIDGTQQDPDKSLEAGYNNVLSAGMDVKGWMVTAIVYWPGESSVAQLFFSNGVIITFDKKIGNEPTFLDSLLLGETINEGEFECKNGLSYHLLRVKSQGMNRAVHIPALGKVWSITAPPFLIDGNFSYHLAGQSIARDLILSPFVEATQLSMKLFSGETFTPSANDTKVLIMLLATQTNTSKEQNKIYLRFIISNERPVDIHLDELSSLELNGQCLDLDYLRCVVDTRIHTRTTEVWRGDRTNHKSKPFQDFAPTMIYSSHLLATSISELSDTATTDMPSPDVMEEKPATAHDDSLDALRYAILNIQKPPKTWDDFALENGFPDESDLQDLAVSLGFWVERLKKHRPDKDDDYELHGRFSTVLMDAYKLQAIYKFLIEDYVSSLFQN